MASLRTLINAQMAALIDGHFGCLDAAAETIFARTGVPVNKSTLSKRLSGQYGWPADEIAALEDAAGISPVSNSMYRRLGPTSATACGSIRAQVGVISKETGESIYATMAAQQSARSEDWAVAVVEIQQAIDALLPALKEAKLRASTPKEDQASNSSGHG